MTRRFRFHAPEEDCWYWFEVAEDGDGWASRQISFQGEESVPVVAADLAELSFLRERCGLLGVQLYEVVYGVLAEGPVEEAQDALPVTEAEFARAWGRARSYRQCDVRHDTGPLPVGTRLPGTFSRSPWGPGRTGVFVELGLPLPGFVDVARLRQAECEWPADGTPAEFEVVGLQLNSPVPQVRLRPTATPPPGEPWPRRGPR